MQLQTIQPTAQSVVDSGKALNRAQAPNPADRTDTPARQDAAADQSRADEARGLLEITGPVEKMMRSVGVDISFRVDDETKQVQAEVRSEDGKRVIRKVPSDEILRLASSIRSMADRPEGFVGRTL